VFAAGRVLVVPYLLWREFWLVFGWQVSCVAVWDRNYLSRSATLLYLIWT